MSDTPRTDAVAPHLNLSHGDMREAAWKLRDLARQLEREVAEANAAARRWHEAAATYATPEALKKSALEVKLEDTSFYKRVIEAPCIKPDCLDDTGRCDISHCQQNPGRA